MTYDQNLYEKLRDSQGNFYDTIMEKLAAKGVKDEPLEVWKSALTEIEYVSALVTQYIGCCAINGVCEFMQERGDEAEYRFALKKMGDVGNRECRKMDMALDLNARVNEAYRTDSSEEVYEAFDKEREEDIGGVASYDLQIALESYIGSEAL